MNGPEHYLEAERLVAEAADRSGPVMSYEDESNQIAEAQVHAILALAAATVAPRSEFHELDGARVDTACADPAWAEVAQ